MSNIMKKVPASYKPKSGRPASLVFEKGAKSKSVPQVIHPVFAGKHLPVEHLIYATDEEAQMLRARTDGKSDTTQWGPQSFTDPSQSRGNTLQSTPTTTTSSPTSTSRSNGPSTSLNAPVRTEPSNNSWPTGGGGNNTTPRSSTPTAAQASNYHPPSASSNRPTGGGGNNTTVAYQNGQTQYRSPSANTSTYKQGTNFSSGDYMAAGYSQYQQPPSRANQMASYASGGNGLARIAMNQAMNPYSLSPNNAQYGPRSSFVSGMPVASMGDWANPKTKQNKYQDRIPDAIPQSLIANYAAYRQPPNDNRLAFTDSSELHPNANLSQQYAQYHQGPSYTYNPETGGNYTVGPRTDPKGPRNAANTFYDTDRFKNALTPNGQRLFEAQRQAALNDGLSVRAFSGRAGRAQTKNHPRGNAIDVSIMGPNGVGLPNYQNPASFRGYEEFAQDTKRQLDSSGYRGPSRWGGYFSYSDSNPADLMHMDVTPNGPTGGGSWASGATPRQLASLRGAQSVGMNTAVPTTRVASRDVYTPPPSNPVQVASISPSSYVNPQPRGPVTPNLSPSISAVGNSQPYMRPQPAQFAGQPIVTQAPPSLYGEESPKTAQGYIQSAMPKINDKVAGWASPLTSRFGTGAGFPNYGGSAGGGSTNNNGPLVFPQRTDSKGSAGDGKTYSTKEEFAAANKGLNARQLETQWKDYLKSHPVTQPTTQITSNALNDWLYPAYQSGTWANLPKGRGNV